MPNVSEIVCLIKSSKWHHCKFYSYFQANRTNRGDRNFRPICARNVHIRSPLLKLIDAASGPFLQIVDNCSELKYIRVGLWSLLIAAVRSTTLDTGVHHKIVRLTVGCQCRCCVRSFCQFVCRLRSSLEFRSLPLQPRTLSLDQLQCHIPVMFHVCVMMSPDFIDQVLRR